MKLQCAAAPLPSRIGGHVVPPRLSLRNHHQIHFWGESGLAGHGLAEGLQRCAVFGKLAKLPEEREIKLFII